MLSQLGIDFDLMPFIMEQVTKFTVPTVCQENPSPEALLPMLLKEVETYYIKAMQNGQVMQSTKYFTSMENIGPSYFIAIYLGALFFHLLLEAHSLNMIHEICYVHLPQTFLVLPAWG